MGQGYDEGEGYQQPKFLAPTGAGGVTISVCFFGVKLF